MKVLGSLMVAGALAKEECFLPIDMMFVQDTTGSFHDDLPNVSKNVPTIISTFEKKYPGSKFGIAEFRDKPYHDLGKTDDFCYHLAQPLTDETEEFQKSWNKLLASGGGDLPEASLQAIINVIQDSSAKWRKINNHVTEPSEEFAGAKVLIVSTDAAMHYPGDYKLWREDPTPAPPMPPAFMVPFPDDSAKVSPGNQCKVYDYPSHEQAAKVVKANDFNIVFLVPNDDQNVVNEWKRFNKEFLNQPDDFVQFIKNDSSDIVTVLDKALGAVSQYICYSTTPKPTTADATTATKPTTTTAAPTTTTTTTKAPTTTTAAPTTTTTAAPTTTTTKATTTTTTTTTKAPTTTTAAPTTTTTAAPTTTTGPVVTTQGPVVTSTGAKSTTAGQECECENQVDCACVPALVVRVNHRPKNLVIDYEK